MATKTRYERTIFGISFFSTVLDLSTITRHNLLYIAYGHLFSMGNDTDAIMAAKIKEVATKVEVVESKLIGYAYEPVIHSDVSIKQILPNAVILNILEEAVRLLSGVLGVIDMTYFHDWKAEIIWSVSNREKRIKILSEYVAYVMTGM